MLEIIIAGGWLMAPILLCSTLAVAIIMERFWADEELRTCKSTGSVVSRPEEAQPPPPA